MKRVFTILVAVFLLTAVQGCAQQYNASVEFIWTAPFDDANDSTSGPCSQYDLRYGTDSATVANWNTATEIIGEPLPGAPGTTETFVKSMNLQYNTVYYFAIKAADEVPNWSPISNVIKVTTPQEQLPPGVIMNLKVELK